MISNRRRRMQSRRRIKRIVIALSALLVCVGLFFGGKFLLEYLKERGSLEEGREDLLQASMAPDESEDTRPEAEPSPEPTPTAAPTAEAIIYPANPGAFAPGTEGGNAEEPVAPAPAVTQPTDSEIVGSALLGVASAETLTGEAGEDEIVNPGENKAEETEKLRFEGLKIGIDPGHQGKGNNDMEPIAPGSSEKKAKVASGTSGVSTKIPEHETNLEISLKLRDALVALGAEVYMTRETADIDISNVERAVMMNELGVDLVLRLHCNGSTNSSANGVGLYVRNTGEGAEESLRAAEALMPEMIAATGAREDGIFKRDTYTGLNWSEVPCILVEMGFMTNPKEDELLNSPDYQDKLVEGMVEGIAGYLLDEE